MRSTKPRIVLRLFGRTAPARPTVMPRPSTSRGAVGARTEDFQGVAMSTKPCSPATRSAQLSTAGPPPRRSAAGPAHQVMVVAPAAPPEELLAARRPHHVDLAGVGERLQRRGRPWSGRRVRPDRAAARAAPGRCGSRRPRRAARSRRRAAGCCAGATAVVVLTRGGSRGRAAWLTRDRRRCARCGRRSARTRFPGRAARRAPRRRRAARAGAGRSAAAGHRATRRVRVRSGSPPAELGDDRDAQRRGERSQQLAGGGVLLVAFIVDNGIRG